MGASVGVDAGVGTGDVPNAGVGVIFVDGVTPATDVGGEVGVGSGVAVAWSRPVGVSTNGVCCTPTKEEVPGPIALARETPDGIASGTLATSVRRIKLARSRIRRYLDKMR